MYGDATASCVRLLLFLGALIIIWGGISFALIFIRFFFLFFDFKAAVFPL